MSLLLNGMLLGSMQSSKNRYANKLLSIRRNNIMRLFPLWEQGGNVAHDIANQTTAPSIGITYGAKSVDNVNTAYTFSSGTTSYVDFLGSNAVDSLNMDTFSVFGWARYLGLDSLNDAASRVPLYLNTDGNNFLYTRKSTAPTSWQFTYRANGTIVEPYFSYAWNPGNAWFSFGGSVNLSKNLASAYMNGNPMGTASGLGDWQGLLTRALIGVAATGGATLPWNGQVAYITIWNIDLTASEFSFAHKI